MTIASQLVSLMGGCLWLKSEVGRGSTFHFTVPLGVGPTPMNVQMADGNGCEASGAMRTEEEQTG